MFYKLGIVLEVNESFIINFTLLLGKHEKCWCQQNSRDVSRDLYIFLNLPQVKYNCAKFYHCRICVTDLGRGAKKPPLHPWAAPEKPIWIGLKVAPKTWSVSNPNNKAKADVVRRSIERKAKQIKQALESCKNNNEGSFSGKNRSMLNFIPRQRRQNIFHIKSWLTLVFNENSNF